MKVEHYDVPGSVRALFTFGFGEVQTIISTPDREVFRLPALLGSAAIEYEFGGRDLNAIFGIFDEVSITYLPGSLTRVPSGRITEVNKRYYGSEAEVLGFDIAVYLTGMSAGTDDKGQFAARWLTGNDTLTGTPSANALYGGGGIDTAVFRANRDSATVSKTVAGYTVTSATDGTDTVVDIERLQFNDIGVALDVGLNQSAGKAVLLLGAALPGQLVFDPSKQILLGNVIDLFDAGYSLKDLSGALLRLPVWDVLTGQVVPTNRDIANYLLTNVNGSAPDKALLDAATKAIDTESFQGDWFAGLASSTSNQLHVGLVGLVDTGLEFLPSQP